MLQSSTLAFLKNIKKNNNKPWFDAHKDQYTNAREDVLALTQKLIYAIGSFEPPIGNLEPKHCIFRINRDVRFSKDKRPYKNNMSAYFNKGGKKSNGSGYYLHLEPGNSFVAGGTWMPEPADLAKIRQEIDYNFDEWKQLTGNPGFKKCFTNGVTSEDSLVRPPKGYDEQNPAILFLKMKSFIMSAPLTDAQLQNKNLVKDVAKLFNTMKPIIDFLNKAIE